MSALTIITIYLVVLLAVGLGSNLMFRGTSKDYMLASHSIGPFFLLMSLFGTTMTAFALVGSTSAAYSGGVGVYGKLASASGIVHSLCFLVIGLPLWRLGNRYGFTTQIEFFRARLQSRRIGLILFPVLVGLVIPYLLIGILGAGGIVSGVTRGTFENAFAEYGGGLPPNLASLIICLVVLLYVFFGGMRGTAWANALQTMVFMILGLVMFVVIAKGIGGSESLIASMKEASSKVDNAHLTRSGANISIVNYASYLLIPLSVGMFPHVFQHWLTAKSANSFKAPIVLHPIFIMIVWAPCIMIGVWAFAWNSNITPSSQVLPTVVREFSSGKLVWLTGVLTAGILAAIMSSLDSQFLCLGTMFTNDIVLEYSDEEKVSESSKVWLARIFVVIVVAVTYGISVYLTNTKTASVFGMGIWCFSGFTALVPLILAALYWKRLTAAGAYASVLTTAALWIWLFTKSDFGGNRGFTYGIAGMLPVVTITVGSTVAMILVSLVTRPPDDKTLAKFFPDSKYTGV